MDKICKKCGFKAPKEWYVRDNKNRFTNKTITVLNFRRAICPACMQEDRDKRKSANRVLVKARSALYNHSKKYGYTPAEFAYKYGWDVHEIALMFAKDYDHACNYCRQSYSEMEHGLRNITLDIINPDEPPYITNVRTCCQTCNTKKGHRGAESFGLDLVMFERRREFLKTKPVQLDFHFN